MEVRMNKEIRDYQESMFFGLNFRQCLFSVLAVAAAVAIYFGLRGRIIDEITGWLSVLGAAPFAACGFFKYHGMTAEQVLWVIIKSEILYPKRLIFRSENIYYQCLAECIQQGEYSCKDSAALKRKKVDTENKKQRNNKKKKRSDAVD